MSESSLAVASPPRYDSPYAYVYYCCILVMLYFLFLSTKRISCTMGWLVWSTRLDNWLIGWTRLSRRMNERVNEWTRLVSPVPSLFVVSCQMSHATIVVAISRPFPDDPWPMLGSRRWMCAQKKNRDIKFPATSPWGHVQILCGVLRGVALGWPSRWRQCRVWQSHLSRKREKGKQSLSLQPLYSKMRPQVQRA